MRPCLEKADLSLDQVSNCTNMLSSDEVFKHFSTILGIVKSNGHFPSGSLLWRTRIVFLFRDIVLPQSVEFCISLTFPTWLMYSVNFFGNSTSSGNFRSSRWSGLQSCRQSVLLLSVLKRMLVVYPSSFARCSRLLVFCTFR